MGDTQWHRNFACHFQKFLVLLRFVKSFYHVQEARAIFHLLTSNHPRRLDPMKSAIRARSSILCIWVYALLCGIRTPFARRMALSSSGGLYLGYTTGFTRSAPPCQLSRRIPSMSGHRARFKKRRSFSFAFGIQEGQESSFSSIVVRERTLEAEGVTNAQF